MSCPPLTLGDGVRIGPDVAVAPGAAIGHHTHVDQGTVIGPSARLGSFVRVSSGVRVGPNAEVGDHSTLAPCCAVDGLVGRKCGLGRDVAVAAGARVVDGVQLKAGVRVGSDTPASSGSVAALTAPSAPRVSLLVSRRPRTVLGRVLALLRGALRSIRAGLAAMRTAKRLFGELSTGPLATLPGRTTQRPTEICVRMRDEDIGRHLRAAPAEAEAWLRSASAIGLTSGSPISGFGRSTHCSFRTIQGISFLAAFSKRKTGRTSPSATSTSCSDSRRFLHTLRWHCATATDTSL